MLLDFKPIVEKMGIKINGVVQIGAHRAQEYDTYKEMGIVNLVFVEPCKTAFGFLKENFSDKAILFNCALADFEGEAVMNTEHDNDGMSNSLLAPKEHLLQHPNIKFTDSELVAVKTLDQLPFQRENYNCLIIDVQGAEGLVIKGGLETIKHIDIIYTEVNYRETYEGCMLLPELTELLNDFKLVHQVKVGCWGDAIFCRKTLLNAN